MRPLQQNTASKFDKADLQNDQVIFKKPVRGHSRIRISCNCGICFSIELAGLSLWDYKIPISHSKKK